MLLNCYDFLCFDVLEVFESLDVFYREIYFEFNFFYFESTLNLKLFCYFIALNFFALLLLLLLSGLDFAGFSYILNFSFLLYFLDSD
jgi:hypothetical protein